MLGDFLTRAKAATLYLAKAGGTLTGALTLADGSAAASEAYVDANAGGYTMSAAELEDWRVRAALLEPAALRMRWGFERYVVPADETHYLQYSWNTRVLDNGAAVTRLEHRDPDEPLPLRGLTLCGNAADSHHAWLDITGITYADARAEYYRKLRIIDEATSNYRRRLGGSAVSYEELLAGPHGSVIRHSGSFDVAWAIGMSELGDRAGADESTALAAGYEDHNFVHQEMRVTQTMRWVCNNGNMSTLGGGIGFDWGLAIGQAPHPQTAPLNWVVMCNLPLSFWGSGVDDEVAPTGVLYGISTVGGLPANWVSVEGTGGSVGVHAVNEWLRVTAGSGTYATGGYGTDTFDPTAGRMFVVTHYQADATAKTIYGVGTGTGIGRADFTHAIEIDGTTIKVLHNPGDGVDEYTATVALEEGKTYRFFITFAADGKAYFEMQSNYVPTGTNGHRLDTVTRYDLLNGVEPATGAGFTDLRMKVSADTNATERLAAWPRITNVLTTPTVAPGYALDDDFGGLPVFSGYASGWASVNNRIPTRQQVGTNVWASTNIKLYSHGIARYLLAADTMRYDLGFGDMDLQFALELSASAAVVAHKFNWDNATSNGWQITIGPASGTFLIQQVTGGVAGASYYFGADATGYTGSNATLGAGWIGVRIRTDGERIRTWLDTALAVTDVPDLDDAVWVACHDITVPGRLYTTQSQIVLSTYDDAGLSAIGHTRARKSYGADADLGETVLIADTFDDTDGTLLHGRTTGTGGAWTLAGSGGTPTATIQGNKAVLGGSTVTYLTRDAGTPNGTIRGHIRGTSGNIVTVCLRKKAGENCLLAGFWSNKITVFTVVAGTPTEIATLARPYSAGVDYDFEITCSGNDIDVTLDGSTLSVTTATHSDGTGFGLAGRSDTVTSADFEMVAL